MIDAFRTQLRVTFNEDAELYDRCRPGYPRKLFADLADLTQIGSGSRVLEIGCGTGKATAPLASFGCVLTAVELGEDLAKVARRNLTEFTNAEVIAAPFEAWPLPEAKFDTVVSATA